MKIRNACACDQAHGRSQKNKIVMLRAALLFFALTILNNKHQLVDCEPTKEFDWSDIGVALTSNPRSSIVGANSANQNNLRILVSPQRRMTKK